MTSSILAIRGLEETTSDQNAFARRVYIEVGQVNGRPLERIPQRQMIEVRHYGTSGPLVVLLHGGPGGPGYMAEVARSLSVRCRVLEPLQRQSGPVPLSVALHVADLHEVIQNERETVHLVGSSWGAMLALCYAARHPEGILQVVLIGCGTFDVRSREVYGERMAMRASAADRERLTDLEALLAAEPEPSRRDSLFGELCDVAFRIQSHEPMASELEVIRFDERGYRETWADVIRLQDEGVQPAEFKNIQAPVLMLHGEVDPHPGTMIRDSLSRHVKNFRYHEFSKCGHIPWLERHAREEFLAVLMDAVDVVASS